MLCFATLTRHRVPSNDSPWPTSYAATSTGSLLLQVKCYDPNICILLGDIFLARLGILRLSTKHSFKFAAIRTFIQRFRHSWHGCEISIPGAIRARVVPPRSLPFVRAEDGGQEKLSPVCRPAGHENSGGL